MTKQKDPCGCGCLPLKQKEIKATVPTKMVRKEKEAPKKSK